MTDNADYVRRLQVISRKVAWEDGVEGGNTALLGLINYGGYGTYESTQEQYKQAAEDAQELNEWTENIVYEVERLKAALQFFNISEQDIIDALDD